MFTVKHHTDFNDFVEFNRSFIESDVLKNIFLIRIVNQVVNGQIRIYKFFTLISDKNEQVVALIVDNICLIYTNSYHPDCLNILSRELEYNRFNKFNFAGDKGIIEGLLKYHNSEYSINKHLIIYKCAKINSSCTLNSGKLRQADLSELEVLTSYSIRFASEYEGNEVTPETMKSMLEKAIHDKCLYIWEDNGICAMALVMHRDGFGFPEIGHVYTPLKFRDKGYCKSLVYKLTEKILESSKYCMLYTQAENPFSNKAFIRVGFYKTGEYVRCFKEE